MIELKNVSIRYIEEYCTLINVCAIFDENSLIVGSIDDGTHTLLRIMAGIERNYDGECIIDGVDIKNIKDRDYDLAYIPNEPYLFTHRSIFYNLYYPLKIRGIKSKDIKNTINDLINQYLPSFPTKIKDMDFNQRKILTLVRALIRKPKYILIEDLFLNLDAKYVNLAHTLINQLSHTTTIIACEPKLNSTFSNYNHYRLSLGELSTK